MTKKEVTYTMFEAYRGLASRNERLNNIIQVGQDQKSNCNCSSFFAWGSRGKGEMIMLSLHQKSWTAPMRFLHEAAAEAPK